MFQQSRREFLEQSMFAAAAAVAGTGFQGGVQARAQEAVGSPNDVIRVAVLGVRGRGGEHLSEMLKRKGVQVVAIVDPDEAVGYQKGVERVEKETGKKPTYFKDLRKAFEDKNIDAVTVATPNHWHSLAAIWAMQAGKDVYLEKPISHNVSEGRRVVEFAKHLGKICQTGTQCRSMQGTIDAVAYVHAGKIGEVKLARGLCYKSRPSIGPKGVYEPPKGLDYDIWQGPAPVREVTRKQFHYDWHWQWDYGNGDLGNQGIHQMDIARWGLGVSDIGQSVLSYGGRLGYEDAGETANTQINIHNYGDKNLVFEVRGLPTDPLKGARVGVIFHGSEGYVVLSSYNGGAAFDLEGKMTQKFEGNGDHFGNFFDAVRSRKAETLNGPVEDGHLSSALCHLGNISYRMGEAVTIAEAKDRLKDATPQPEVAETFERVAKHLADNHVDLSTAKLHVGPQLTIDPVKESFTGAQAAQANPMLTREYRAPYVVPAKVG